MRYLLLRPRQNEHSGFPKGAIIGIAVGGTALAAAITVTAIYMFYLRHKRSKGRKRQSAIDESLALGVIPPPALNTQFAGRSYYPRIGPILSSSSAPAASTRYSSPASPPDPEESRVWAEWLIQTAPKPKPSTPAIQTNISPASQLDTNSPWLESAPGALPEGRGSRITNVFIEDARSPIELELADDSQFEVQATSGPLPGPSAMPASPPMGTRSTLQPRPRIVSIRRKPIGRPDPDPASSPQVVSNPTSTSNPESVTISSVPASPKSTDSNRSSSRPPSLPYPDFNVPTSPDELFIPPIVPLGPILELTLTSPSTPESQTSSLAQEEEDASVLLARQRVERLREERQRLERIHELKKMEEQAKRDLLEAQRSSMESKRWSEEAQRRTSGGRSRD